MKYRKIRFSLVFNLLVASILFALGAAAQQPESVVECDEGVIAEPVEIALGNSTSNCVVDNATDRDRFTLTSTVGTNIRILVLSQTNFFDPRLEIRDPNGTVLYDNFCPGQNQFNQGLRCSFQADLTLPETGNYDLSISDSGANETGAYIMQVESIPPDFVPDQALYDVPQSDTIGPGTDVDFFRFYGQPGTEVRINLFSNTNFYDPRLEVWAPDGSLLTDQWCAGQNQFNQGLRCTTAFTFVPDQAGDYLIAISDQNSNEGGGYELSLFCLFGACDSDGDGNPDPAPPIIAYDDSITEPISSATDGGFFAFNVAAGSTVRLNVFSTTNFFDPAVEIRDSSGALIESQVCLGQNQFNQGLRCSFSISLDVQQSDLYSLALYDSSTNEGGGASISLFCLHGSCDSDGMSPPDSEPPYATYVSSNAASLTEPTDGLFYRLYGIQGAAVRVDVLSTSNFLDPVMEIRDPSGEVLVSGFCAGQNQFNQGLRCGFPLNVTLPDTGYYDIAIFDSGTNEGGGIRFSAHCFDGTCDSDADGLVDPEPDGVNYGGSLEAPISPATDLDFYVIHGTAGDDIQITVVSMTNFFDPRLEVYDPNGALVDDMFCAGQNQFNQGLTCSFTMNLNSLPQTGLYRLAVSDSSANESGSYLLGVQCVFGTCNNPPPPSSEGDNCIEFANGPLIPDAGGNVQLDTDEDGIGNHCDTDLNNDCIVNFLDVSLYGDVFLSADPDGDFNGNGFVNFVDLSILAKFFLTDFTVENPSGIPNLCD